jgi:hypothetical protein
MSMPHFATSILGPARVAQIGQDLMPLKEMGFWGKMLIVLLPEQ